MERLKRKILQAHKQAKSIKEKPDAKRCSQVDTVNLTDGYQVPHPDFAKVKEAQMQKLVKESQVSKKVISLSDYLKSHP